MARLTGWLALALASQMGVATGEIGEYNIHYNQAHVGRRTKHKEYPYPRLGLPVFAPAVTMHSFSPCIPFDKDDSDSPASDRCQSVGSVGSGYRHRR